MKKQALGIHLMVWSGNVTEAEMVLLPKIKEMGYDGVEIPIFDPKAIDVSMIRQAISDSGLRYTTSTAMAKGLSLIDADSSKQGFAWMQQVIRTAAALGANLLCGPMCVPVGELRGRGYSEEEWERCVHSFQEIGKIAADEGVTIALEPLNRFETFMLNTVDDGVKLMDQVNHPSVGLLLDTFHMHIEEKSIANAIRRAGKHIKHFHCSENDRGTVGTGQVAWEETFQALDEINYDGWMVVESFNAVIPELAGATCIWRQLAESPEALAQQSLQFLRNQADG
ncbi:MAG: sugar phosphate isomerase/epimerase family protein [Chloroflexota bacterium]